MAKKKKLDLRKVDFLLHHRFFWLGLALIIIILPFFSLISLDVPLPSGKAVQTIAYEKAGTSLHFEVKNIDGLKEAILYFSEDVKNMVVNFEKIDLPSSFLGLSYSAFRVSSPDADKIEKIKFTLKLSEAELAKLNLPKDEVRLYLNNEEFETKLTKTKDNYIFYEATADQLGDFILGKKSPPKVLEEKPEAPAEEIPPPVVKEPKELPPALEQPAPPPVKKGLFSRLGSLIKNLFN